jgi:hypothetical protein
MRRRAAVLALVALVWAAAGPAARAAEPAPAAFAGGWTATKHGTTDVFRGTWRATVTANAPNDVTGTWAIVSPLGDEVMSGTWSARKTPRGWRGGWSARIAPPGAGVVSGTWEADARGLVGAKTFRDLLARTAEHPVAGVWRLGHARGNWWLQARP